MGGWMGHTLQLPLDQRAPDESPWPSELCNRENQVMFLIGQRLARIHVYDFRGDRLVNIIIEFVQHQLMR